MRKAIIPILLALFLAGNAFGQQQPVSSQYLLNKYFINPAVAGDKADLQIAAMYKKLWAGFEGAPSMQFLTGHMTVASNMGVGAQIFNMSSGPLARTGFTGTYAYHVPLNGNGDRLAFGLSGTIYQYRIDRANLNLEEEGDEAVTTGSDRMVVPDASFGTYYYTDRYYVGLSVSQLFSRKIDLLKNSAYEQRQVRHYYLLGGYNIDVNSDFSIEPSLLMKLIEAGVLQADINVLARYQDTFWGGLSFRPTSALAILLGYRSDMVSVGYSYDINLTAIGKQSYGSHEILLMLRLQNFLSATATD